MGTIFCDTSSFSEPDAERIRQRIACRSLDTSADIDDWNAGKIPVALAHPASIGHGLNLQYGGHITIWYGMTWSLELYQQANERLNRPGQTQICRVYHLTVEGTHDERVLKSLQNKDKGQAAAIEALRLEIIATEQVTKELTAGKITPNQARASVGLPRM